MLCKKCGRAIKDNIKFCPYCGEPNTGSYGSDVTMAASDEPTVGSLDNNFEGGFVGYDPPRYDLSSDDYDNNKTVSSGSDGNVTVSAGSDCFSENNIPSNDTARAGAVGNQPIGSIPPEWDTPFPPDRLPDNPIDNSFHDGFSNGSNIPYSTPQTPPRPAAYPARQPDPEMRRNSGGPRKAIAVIVTIVASIGIAFAIFLLISNSDWFKLARAESAILDGRYDDGKEMIESLDSDRAKAVRGFAEVIRLRDELKELYNTETLCDFDSEAYKKAKKFKEKLNDFTEDYKAEKLTEKLSECYTDYVKASANTVKLLYDSKVSEQLVTAQYSIKEYDNRKHGSSFTISSLTAIKEKTQDAYDQIERSLTDTDEYKDFSKSYSGKATSAMSEYCSAVKNQIEQDQYELDQNSSKYGDKSISYMNTDSSHKAVVADGLYYADSDTHISKNAEMLIASLDCSMLIDSFDSSGND